MPSRKRSTKGQQTFDHSKRGKWLRDIEQARFGDPIKRLIVMVLDTKIRDGSTWDISFEDLAELCEIHRTTCKRKCDELKDEQVLDYEDVPRSDRKRFFLARANIEDHRVEKPTTRRGSHHRDRATTTRPGTDRPPGEADVHDPHEMCTVHVHRARDDVHDAHPDVHDARPNVHDAHDTLLSAQSAHLNAPINARPQNPIHDPRGDPLVFEAELIRRWNDCEGVAQHTQAALSWQLSQKLIERLSEPGWWERAQQALGKFPLANGVVIGLRKFLEPETVDEILGGVHDWKRDSAIDKTAARVGEGQRYSQRSW